MTTKGPRKTRYKVVSPLQVATRKWCSTRFLLKGIEANLHMMCNDLREHYDGELLRRLHVANDARAIAAGVNITKES